MTEHRERTAGSKLLFRHGHINRSAVELCGIRLNAVGRDELTLHPRQPAGVDGEGLADAVQQAEGGACSLLAFTQRRCFLVRSTGRDRYGHECLPNTKACVHVELTGACLAVKQPYRRGSKDRLAPL